MPDRPYWEIIPEEDEEKADFCFHALGYGAVIEEPDWYVYARYDGCIHLYHAQSGFKVPVENAHNPEAHFPDEVEQFHLCEYGGLDGLIASLVSLVAVGQEYFRGNEGSVHDPWDEEDPDEMERRSHSLATTLRLLQAGLEPPSTEYWTNTRSYQ